MPRQHDADSNTVRHARERTSEPTKKVALETSRQEISVNASLGVYTFPTVETMSVETRPRGGRVTLRVTR